jgi:NAD-dependent DNA ligase
MKLRDAGEVYGINISSSNTLSNAEACASLYIKHLFSRSLGSLGDLNITPFVWLAFQMWQCNVGEAHKIEKMFQNKTHTKDNLKKFENKTFSLIGSISRDRETRDFLHIILTSFGGTIIKHITPETDIVIAASDAPPVKMEAAAKLKEKKI